jgi:branched-chain amino acid transport system permease protein
LEHLFSAIYISRLVRIWIEAYPEMDIFRGFWLLGGVRIFKTQAAAIVGAIIMMLILYTIVQRTKIGKAMRSVSEDKEVAALMGINVDRVIATTFALGGASAGVAGILYLLLFPVAHFFMGFFPGLKALPQPYWAALGVYPGAFLGAMAVGFARIIGPNLFLDGLGITGRHQLKDAIALPSWFSF